ATVMGHEVAHATQRHGVERISRGLLEQIAQFGAVAGAATGKVNPAVVQGLLSAYGVGVVLPFSRVQESEADYIGLRLMAQAGYDPHESIAFWERMSGCPRNMIGKLCFRSGAGVPEFLSTHPSEETRIKNLERWIPQAMQYYNPPPDAPPPAPPATIMTDPELADRTYIEPITLDVIEQVIQRERPDALLPTMGGQTALNAAVGLAEQGILKKYGVQLIGASYEAIRKAEDREAFK